MQCYKITPNAPHSGGCALVSATCTAEAISCFCDSDYRNYIYDYAECTCNIVVGLDYDCDEAKIIFEAIYCE